MSENPYAPPTNTAPGGIPDAPKDYGWRIRDGKLKVLAASQLPMVDPFNGGSDETMMLQEIKLRHHPWWLAVLPLAGAALPILLSIQFGWIQGLPFVIPGFLFGGVIAFWLSWSQASCSVRVFMQKQTVSSRVLHKRITLGLFLTIVPGAFLFQLGPEWMNKIPVVMIPIWIGSLLFGVIRHRRLKCRKQENGFFEITGLHPEAIRKLGAIKLED